MVSFNVLSHDNLTGHTSEQQVALDGVVNVHVDTCQHDQHDSWFGIGLANLTDVFVVVSDPLRLFDTVRAQGAHQLHESVVEVSGVTLELLMTRVRSRLV